MRREELLKERFLYSISKLMYSILMDITLIVLSVLIILYSFNQFSPLSHIIFCSSCLNILCVVFSMWTTIISISTYIHAVDNELQSINTSTNNFFLYTTEILNLVSVTLFNINVALCVISSFYK